MKSSIARILQGFSVLIAGFGMPASISIGIRLIDIDSMWGISQMQMQRNIGYAILFGGSIFSALVAAMMYGLGELIESVKQFEVHFLNPAGVNHRHAASHNDTK
ncbi:MAG: hypothetical protein FWF76_01530 [Oscillospiraceae bacterium]|nr:hypothetical protein [Oscillospiraceae bacterium]